MTHLMKQCRDACFRFHSRLAVLILCLGCTTVLTGCGGAGTADEISDADFRKAVNELEKLGARISEENEPLIESSVNMVVLFPEHFDKDGEILPEVLQPLRNIRSCLLGLFESRITDDGLKALAGYRNVLGLNFHNTMISDEGLVHVSQLRQLLLLKLSHTRITHDGITRLANLNKLELIYVAGLEITEETLDHIARMPSLRGVNLAETTISNAGIKKLTQLRKLKYLGLDSTNITDDCLEDLMKFPDLQHLEVTKTDLSDEGIEKLEKFYPDDTVIHDR